MKRKRKDVGTEAIEHEASVDGSRSDKDRESEDDRAARVARALEHLRETAKRVGELSSGESAVSAVSRQRR